LIYTTLALQLLVDNAYGCVLYLPSESDVTVYYLQTSVASLVPTLINHGERKTWRNKLEASEMGGERNAGSWFKSVGYLTLAFVSLLLIPAQRLIAQVDEGSIVGTVTDPTGAVVPNAKITLVNTDQGITLQSTSSGSGEYSFSPVRIGNYTLTAVAPGFSTTTQEHLSVNVGQVLQVNVQLKTGAATETVEVTTAPPQLQTDEGSVGQVVSERSVNSLPLNGRNFTFLAQLGAGVNTPQADTRGNAASGAFTANGLRPAQNNYLLDGIDNNSNAVDFLNGTNFAVLPPVDAIQEFNVQTADFSAQLGRSAGAVLNATIKSGTNNIHGAVWEFFRNNVLDARNYFDTTKAELRLNQFGATIGGPIIKNKIFFFGDYEGLRHVEGNSSGLATVPTALERSTGFTNLSELLTATTKTDLLGRAIPVGTVFDPATTRQVTSGEVDPVSGIAATGNGFVRDPFGSCGPGTLTYTATACGLNQLPATRLDGNAIKLLNLYPEPINGAATGNFSSNPNLFQHSNQFDVRGDVNLKASDQVFVRFSYVDNPQYIPGPFGGIADGGSFQQGVQTLKSNQSVLAWTHVFKPDTINVARVGFNHLHTTRFGPEGGTLGIPAQFGIQDIPQVSENGGLPTITPSGLATLGSNNFLPSDETSQTLQIVDDFTKIYGAHSFKMGLEYQHVKFSTLQPAWSRGQFDYNGSFTDIPNLNSSTTGIAQMLLTPIAAPATIDGAPNPNGLSYSGGSDEVRSSNINKTYDAKNYFAVYFQDDWKVNPRLTLNLGLRWDYFGPIQETNGGQANFIPSAVGPFAGPTYLIPASGKDDRSLSDSFTTLLAKDGIALDSTDKYGRGLVRTQKSNFAPRLGFAYQATQRLVTRGGVGWFFNSFENQGYGPNIGENYPFVFNFNYVPLQPGNIPNLTNGAAPIGYGTPYAGCGLATLNTGFSCFNLTPLEVDASGLGLQGLQFNYKTPLTVSANLTLQYAVTHAMSAQVSYVFTDGMHLQQGLGTNNVTAILPASFSNTVSPAIGGIPFPDFGSGSSYNTTTGASIYNGLQTKLEQQFSNGANFLAAYTWSKTLSDAGDLLNGGNSSSGRAPDVPGFGPRFDWGPADFDIRNVFHFSGGYQLPFGKDKRFAHDAGKLEDAVIGGWSVNAIVTVQGGQPMTLGCPTGTTQGTGCYDVEVPGQSQKRHIYVDGNGLVNWFGNAKAFQQPCQLGVNAAGTYVPIPGTPAGCIPYIGRQILGGSNETSVTPPLKTFDFSTFKALQISERFSLQFRAEFFNIFNHPNFNAPGFGGNGVVAIANSTNFNSAAFGEIGSTRTAPRQIQFALKLYY